MVANAPSVIVGSGLNATAESRSLHVPDEEDIARWAALYEALPADIREAIEEHGLEIQGALKR